MGKKQPVGLFICSPAIWTCKLVSAIYRGYLADSYPASKAGGSIALRDL